MGDGGEGDGGVDRARALLDAVGLVDRHDHYPIQLSGGEQQRAVIARAVLNKPQIILADEPTGHLDPETAEAILILMRNLAKEHQTAILMATHNAQLIDRFPGRVYRVGDGTVVEVD